MAWEKFENIKGPKGEKGDTGTVASVSAATLPAGAAATVKITGETDVHMHLGIPRGDKGDRGPAGAIASASAESVPAGQQAAAIMSGSDDVKHLHLQVPRGLPGVNGIENDSAVAEYVQAADSETRAAVNQAVMEYTQRWMVDVTDLGAIGDDEFDNTEIIQSALNAYDVVAIPAGVFRVSELKIPSRTELRGAGKAHTTLRLVDGAPRISNVLTNLGNTRLPHENYDSEIKISGITFDGNSPAREQTGSTANTASGSCLAFAAVKDADISDCHFTRGYLHGLDISASVYVSETDVTDTPVGPSVDIRVSNCTSDFHQQDDAFTTHASGPVTFRNCHADRTAAPSGYAFNRSSQGFEIDDASFSVSLYDCTAKGYAKGFQVKGHETSRPASNVLMVRCAGIENNWNFEISHVSPGVLPAGVAPMATDVRMISCESIAPAVAFPGDFTQRRALVISGYSGVKVENFTLKGGARNAIRVSEGAENVVFDGLVIENTQTETENSAQGLIHFFGSVGRGMVVRNVSVTTPILGHLITHITGADVVIENVYARGLWQTGQPNAYVVNLSDMKRGSRISSIFGEGFTVPIRVGAGPAVGTFPTRHSVAPIEELYIGGDSSEEAPSITSGTGAPGAGGAVGSIYLRSDGGSGPRLYVKETSGASGWVAK